MTLYMAIDGRSPTQNSRSEWLATLHTSAVASTGSAMPSAGDSLSSLVRGLAPRTFGSVIGGVIYQPNLINCCDKLRPPDFPTLTTDNTIWSPSTEQSKEFISLVGWSRAKSVLTMCVDFAKRLCFTGKFLFNEPVEEEQRGAFLGMNEIGVDENAPNRHLPVCRLIRQNGNDSFYMFVPILVNGLKPSKVAAFVIRVAKRSCDSLPWSCYGYARENEVRREGCANPSKLLLFHTERADLDHFEQIANPSSGPALTPFHLCYAAYLYYRSREQIVPPFLTLDGVDFLLYIEPTRLRHAVYAVIVVPANDTRSACDVAAGLHVAPSVAMSLRRRAK
uniref:Uncharacterized protein n=1 Tax=Echinococcus canadensis TaxID=519352 RepID=A0A915EW57_9CEST